MIVAGARSRCRIACRTVSRGRTEPVPDRVPYRRSRAHGAGAGSRAVPSVAGERSRCRTRRGGWSSRAVSPVAGSRAVRPVAHSRPVTSRPTLATSRLCDAHGRVCRTPVVGHAPAQHSLSPTPLTAVYEHVFFYTAVAFPRGTLGGAAIAVLRRLQKALTSYIFVDRLRYKIMDVPAVSSLSSISLHGFLVTKAYFSVYVRFTTNLGLL